MKELKYDDEVRFRVGDIVLGYRVRDDHMYSTDLYDNHVVFQKLGLSEAHKKALATKYYGYKPTGGDWPYFRKNDFKAVTELVKAVHDLCNKHNIKLREDERA